MGIGPDGPQPVDDGLNLLGGGPKGHHDDHLGILALTA